MSRLGGRGAVHGTAVLLPTQHSSPRDHPCHGKPLMEGEWWLGRWTSIISVEFRIKKWDKVMHQGVRVNSSS